MKFHRQTQRRDFFRRLQAQTYQSRRFGNPYFPKHSRSSSAKYAVIGLMVGLVIALVSFFFTSSTFEIRAVRVEGTETVPSKAIIDVANGYLGESRLLIFSASNRFLLNVKGLSRQLSKSFSFDRLDVTLDHHDLVIRAVERVSTFVWAGGEDLYLIDRGGVVIRKITPEEYQQVAVLPAVQGPVRDGETLPGEESLLRFVDLADQPVEIGKTVLTVEEIETVFAFLEALQPASIHVDELEIDRTMGSWMSAVTSVGYRIYFDPTSDPTTQVARLEAVLRDSVPDPSVLEYVDLRFEDHVYVK